MIRWLLLSCALALTLGAPNLATADGISGSVGARGNYYWESSTRVVAPAINGTLVTGSGVRFEATYLVDAITSASQASGVQSDVTFTEIRNDVSAGAGYELDLGTAQLDLSLRGRVSKEPDYLSRGTGFSGALNLNDRTTTLSINGYLLHDAVSKVDRMAPSSDPERLQASDPIRVGRLNALSTGLALDQVLTPTSILTVGYDGAFLSGFQANPYRQVAYADGGGAPEKHPDDRIRHAVYAWFAYYVLASRSAIRLGYRLYQDSWNIRAHAPEARVHQEIGDNVELRLRYRYYTQTASEFFRPGGNVRADRYITADPKMSAFHDQTIGAKLRIALDFLAFTPLDFARRAILDFGVEYIFNTNRYGNGVIGQGGLTWPF